MLLILLTLITLTISQSYKNCTWSFTRSNGQIATLDLSRYKGRKYYTTDVNNEYFYSICDNGDLCKDFNGNEYESMINISPQGVNLCKYIAKWDDSVTPLYDYHSSSWIFTYNNGQTCSNGNKTKTMVIYTCNPLITGNPILIKAESLGDDCSYLLLMETSQACIEGTPNNIDCRFRSGSNQIDLSTLKGQKITYLDNNSGLTWVYTPCLNNLNCNNINVMANIQNNNGDCAKFLAIWSGDNQPVFINSTNGQSWGFEWLNGEECSKGAPLEQFQVFWNCVENGNDYTVQSVEAQECVFKMNIGSRYACVAN